MRDVPMTTDDKSTDDKHLSDDCQFTILNDGTSKGLPMLDVRHGFQLRVAFRPTNPCTGVASFAMVWTTVMQRCGNLIVN